MAKIYTKNTWVDEILAAAERYNLVNADDAILFADVGLALIPGVVQAGSPVTAARMNNIEDGIDGLDTLVDGILGDMPEGGIHAPNADVGIVSGAITIDNDSSLFTLSAESGTADVLTTLTPGTGVTANKIIILTAASGHVITYGTIVITDDDFVWLRYNGSAWAVLKYPVEKKTAHPEILLLDAKANLAVEDGIGSVYFVVPSWMDGWELTGVQAHVFTVSSSGTPTFQIHNVTDAVDLLSTRITIDANEKDSKDATAAAVINSSYKVMAAGDELRFDCDVAGTGTKGLVIMLTFEEA